MKRDTITPLIIACALNVLLLIVIAGVVVVVRGL